MADERGEVRDDAVDGGVGVAKTPRGLGARVRSYPSAIQAERLAALAQARADAAVDAISKESAQAQLETIREAEKVKTQALKDQLARQLVISEILAEIVRVRSSYAEQRSIITNEFLKARAAASAEVAGYETRIREYRRLNSLLFEQITKQHEAIAARLAETEALEAEDRADVDTLREADAATARQSQENGPEAGGSGESTGE